MSVDPLRPAPGEDADEQPAVLILPEHVDDGHARGSLGTLGRPFDRETSFFIGLTGAFGVAAAYFVVRGLADIATVLVIIGLALFIAIGLNPIVEAICVRGFSRRLGVAVVTVAFVVVVASFIAAAAVPLARELHDLILHFPRYREEVLAGKGWLGHIVVRLHLVDYLRGKKTLRLGSTSGILGAGKMVLGAGFAAITVVVLTVYFLVALPSVRRLFSELVPRSRREHVGRITDEIFERVGGFMLGNLLTSLVAGTGTFLWLIAFGVPYPFVLALGVALLDLIPMIGSTLAGAVVSLVALSRGLPIAVMTLAFYVAYRLLEDYLLNPRVMKHTVRVSPGLTIVATLVGGALLGLIGALVAIPAAATAQLLLEEVVFPANGLASEN